MLLAITGQGFSPVLRVKYLEPGIQHRAMSSSLAVDSFLTR